VNPRRLRIGEWIAGIGGVVLLASTFLDWYDVDSARPLDDASGGGTLYATGSVSAWEALSVVDVLIALTAVLAIASAVMAAAHNTPAASLALASLAMLVGLFATIAVVVRVLSPPEFSVGGVSVPGDDVSLATGAWIGLAACVVTTLGSLAAMRDERFPRGARIDVPVETIPPPEGGKA
jgi:hypothetical protein